MGSLPQPLSITLRGITNDATDCGVDVWRTVTFPLLRQITGLDDFELKVGTACPGSRSISTDCLQYTVYIWRKCVGGGGLA